MGHSIQTIAELLKDKAIIQKFAHPSQIFKEYKASEAEAFFANPRYKSFYGSVVEVGDKGKENLKAVAEELDVDLASLFSLYEYVGSESVAVIAKLTKGNFQEDQANVMVKPLLPLLAEEQAEVYKVLQLMISVREMPQHHLYRPFADFVELLASKHDLLTHLWQDYKGLWKKKEPKAFKTSKAQFFFSKVRQQIWILMAIFKGNKSGLFKIDDKLFLEMFNTFKDQQFQGSLALDMPDIEGTPFQNEIISSFEDVKHLAALILVEALKLGEILRMPPAQLLSSQSRTYAIVTRVAEEVFRGLTELEEQNNSVAIQISYFSMAMYTAVDAINLIIDLNRDPELEDMKKRLTDTIRRANVASNHSFEQGIESLFASDLYEFFTTAEKDLVKSCLKDFFTLLIIPKATGVNVLERSNDSEIDFIAKTMFRIIDTPQDLEEFWSKFDKDYVYGNSMPTVLSNFLDMFPHKAELTFGFASHILGSGRGHTYVGQVIDLFSSLTKYTLAEDSDAMRLIKYSEMNRADSEEMTYILTEDFEVPKSNGFIIPAKTKFTMTEKKGIKFNFKYNYWNVFWKSITAVIVESVNKNIALTNAQFKFIKLICKMIRLEPLQAPNIQLMMLTTNADQRLLSDIRVRESEVQGYAGLALIFFECLNLCKSSSEHMSIVLSIMKALNNLMVSDISTELILVAQFYPLLSQEEQGAGQVHVLASLIDIFKQKYFGKINKPAFLLSELIQFTETVILKSDYLFENFPPKEYLNNLSSERISQDQAEISEIASHYFDMQTGGYWVEEYTKKLNDRIFKATVNYVPGTKLLPCTLIPDLLELVLSQVMDMVNNNSAINFEECPDTRMMIKARVFSILDNLAARLKSGNGNEMLRSRGEGPNVCFTYLANFFKSINFCKYLLRNFDIEIGPQDVFFGLREPTEGVNGLGLENSLYQEQVLHSKIPVRTTEAFQALMVEVTKCFETICGLVLESIKDPSSPAARLAFVTEFKANLLNVEDFYKNLFSNFSQEYSANFFIMLMALSDFNNEKGAQRSLTCRIHTFETAIATLTNPALYFMDNTKDYPYMFSFKINQNLILTAGKQEKILKSNSISTAALHAMYSVLKLWRKANRANKPVVADLLSGGQLSPHFSNQVFDWLHKVIIGHLSNIQNSPFEALHAMKFIGECLISQPTYFNHFIKYCSKQRENKLKMNGLVYMLHLMITDLEQLSLAEIFEESCYFECLCQIMQLVAILYLRPSVRKEILTQLPPFVFPGLATLVARIIDQRKAFIGNFLEIAKEIVIAKDGRFLFCQDKPLSLTVNMTRIKYLADQECNFCYSLASFLRVLNCYTFESTRDDLFGQSTPFDSQFISSKLYLKVQNYVIDSKRLASFAFTDQMLSVVTSRLLSTSKDQGHHGLEQMLYTEKNFTVNQEQVQFDLQSYKEPFYDPDWGFAFNLRDTETKMRESSLDFKFANTALLYLDLYNVLNRILVFGKILGFEANKNISLTLSTGMGGHLLSASLNASPSISPKLFVKNILGMMESNLLKTTDSERNIDQMIKFAASLRDENISDLQKKLFNPLHEVKLHEWAGNLYGISGNYLEDLNTFRVLVDSCTTQIDILTALLIENTKAFGTSLDYTTRTSPIYEILQLLCQVSFNHLAFLGQLMANSYYRMPLKSVEDKQDFIEAVRKIISSVSSFIYNLHHGIQYQTDAPDAAIVAFDQMHVATYYSLFTLSQMPEDVRLRIPPHTLKGTLDFIRQLIREHNSMHPVAIQCFILLIKILPDAMNGADLSHLLLLLKDSTLLNSSYKSICHLLVVAFDSPRLKKTVATAMTINAVVSCKRFIDKQTFSQMQYYQGEVLEEELSNWMWTLNVLVHSFKPIKENTGSIDPILSFVKMYMNRILSVLGFQFASLAGQISLTSLNSDVRSRSECFRSTAYVEELELTVTLMNLLFMESAIWATNHRTIFDNLMYVMMTRTLLLFETNQSINEQYLAISWTEKLTAKIRVLGTQEKEHTVLESSRKPSMVPKATAKKSSFVSDYGRTSEYFDLAGSNNPDIFSFNIEVHLIKVAFHLISALLEGMEHVDFSSGGATGVGGNLLGDYGATYTHGAFGATTATNLTAQGNVRFRYDVEFWRQIPSTLRNAQQYIAKTIGRMINCQDLYSKGIVNLILVNNSAEFANQSRLINSIFAPLTTAELHKMGFAAMEMTYLVAILLIQSFDNCDKTVKLQASEAIKRCKAAFGAGLSDYERINKATMSVAPREKPSVSLRRHEEEVDEDRSFLVFVRKYFPQN